MDTHCGKAEYALLSILGESIQKYPKIEFRFFDTNPSSPAYFTYSLTHIWIRYFYNNPGFF